MTQIMSLNNVNLYIRFLESLNQYNKSIEVKRLNSIDKAIILAIFESTCSSLPPQTKDILSRKDIASPVTLHKHLHSLISSNFIEITKSNDRREKRLRIGSFGKRYLRGVDNCMKRLYMLSK